MDLKTITFPGKEPDETVILFLRRHWSVVARLVITYMFLGLIPFVVAMLSVNFTPVFDDSTSFLFVAAVLAGSLYELVILNLFFRAWIDYYLDVWIVTDERIVNIEQHGLFNRTVAEQRLSRVQDVTHVTKGILPTFLRFGDVFVQTAAEKTRFVFQQVAHPDVVARTVLELHERYIATHGGEDEQPPPTAKPAAITTAPGEKPKEPPAL